MKFTKMHGLGNDYIFVNCFEENVKEPKALAKKMSARHFGVGSDGLVLIMPSEKADFRMRIFNPDGSEAEMCGNAVRCVAKYVRDRNMIDADEFEIETLAGIIKPKVISSGRVSMVRVDMGEPVLERKKIPMAGSDGKVIDDVLDAGGTEVKITCVSMGNPHCVIFVESVDFPEFGHLGKIIENHDLFPNRINVEFVNVLNEHEIEMRVWERGVGESLACGTGACAVAVACVLNKKAGRDVIVYLKGGDLKILWDEKTNHVYMTGSAETVYEGEWNE